MQNEKILHLLILIFFFAECTPELVAPDPFSRSVNDIIPTNNTIEPVIEENWDNHTSIDGDLLETSN